MCVIKLVELNEGTDSNHFMMLLNFEPDSRSVGSCSDQKTGPTVRTAAGSLTGIYISIITDLFLDYPTICANEAPLTP